jgi:sterol desaturase/sphingolipid hydroxylase (fatty acid hydroxylase superfamily)
MTTLMVVLGFGLAMLAVERAWPGQRFESARGWWLRAALLNALQGLIAYFAVLTWDRWLPQLALWHMDAGSTPANALIGYVVITFVFYWWHRARHEIPLLWRRLHQVHHSPSRIEVLTAFYKHPFEIALNGVLSSTILFVVLGMDAASAALAVLLTGLGELFYHWNVRTPRWLGYFFQRPESHCVHHQRGRHTNNFSDLPLWDMAFGTFENPVHCPAQCGFGARREARLGSLLLGRTQ